MATFFDKIPGYEALVKDSGYNGKFKIQSFSIPVPGEDLRFNGKLVSPSNGFKGYFYAEKHAKKRVVLHFTAGVLTGDLSCLMSKDRGHVSTSFVLARDGTAYRPFSSSYWSYHLGRGALGGNGTGSKSGIGIEMSNMGPLYEYGNDLRTYNKKTVYCTKDQVDRYIKIDTPFRGTQYFASFTEEQYDTLIIMLRYLTAAYKIPRAFLPESTRYETSLEAATFNGIISHVNSRSSGKWDIGPAFDWERVIAGVTADVYEPVAPQERSMFIDPDEISDAEEMDRGFTPGEDNKDDGAYGEDGPDVSDIEDFNQDRSFSADELDEMQE